MTLEQQRQTLNHRLGLERRQATSLALKQGERRREIDRRISNLRVNDWLATFHNARVNG